MDITINSAIEVMRELAAAYMADELGHLYHTCAADRMALQFLDSAGQIEIHNLTDELGRVVRMEYRLRQSGAPDEPSPPSGTERIRDETALDHAAMALAAYRQAAMLQAFYDWRLTPEALCLIEIPIDPARFEEAMAKRLRLAFEAGCRAGCDAGVGCE